MNQGIRAKKIALAKNDGWEDGYRNYFSDQILVNIINELCGSLDTNKKLNLDINHDKENIIIMNDSYGLSNDDIKRLDKFASGNITENKYGDSERGAGTRCAFRACSNSIIPDIDITKDYVNTEIIGKFSILISKVSEDIVIEEYKINVKCGDYLLYCYDKENKYFFYNVTGENILKPFVNDLKHMNTIFICPYENIQNFGNSNLVFQIRRLFNRCDCNIKLNNKNITENKKYKLFDKTISSNMKYIEFKLKIFNKKNKFAKIEIIDSQNIQIDENINYNFKGGKCGKDLLKSGREYWIMNDNDNEDDNGVINDDDNGVINEEYSCIIRLQSSNDINNEDYCKYYYGMSKLSGEINGILPYIGNKCLRYEYPSKKMSNNNKRIWMEGIPSDRPTTKKCTRTIDCEKTTYDNGLYWQCEIQEDNNYNKEKSFFNKTIEKCMSEIKNDKECSKEYHKNIPYFMNFFIKEYIWSYSSKENIEEEQKEKALKKAEEARKKAEEKTKQAEKEKLKAEEKTKQAEEKTKQAEKAEKLALNKAKQEKEAKIKAEEKTKQVEKEKLKAEEKTKQAKKEKAKAEEKTKQAEKEKLKAEEKTKQEKEAKIKAEEKTKQEEEEREIIEEELKEVKDINNEQGGVIKEQCDLLVENNICQDDDGYHVYAMFDRTRPLMRKTGRTKKSKNLLQKQYSTRYFPEGTCILAFINFEEEKEMNSAENHLQNNLTKKYRNFYEDKPTEWLKFPEDWTKEKMDKYCIDKVNSLQEDD